MKKLWLIVIVVLAFCGYKSYIHNKEVRKAKEIAKRELSHLSVIDRSLPFIKKFEGFSAIPYTCSDKEVVIGYGTHVSKVKSKKITEAEASKLLKDSLEYFLDRIENVYFKDVPLSDNRKIALLSLLYNLGETKFNNSLLYTMLKKEDAFTKKEISAEWALYNRAKMGGKRVAVKGLTERRLAETRLYFK